MKKLASILLGMVLSLSGLWAQTNWENPATYILGGIEVEGNEYVPSENIISQSGLTPGSQIMIPGQDIADAIKRMWRAKVFQDIQVEIKEVVGDKVFLIIRVEERPRISYFTPRGPGVTKSQVDDIKENLGFMRRTMWTPEKEANAERKIRNYYIEKGFFETKTTFRVFPDTVTSLPGGVVVDIYIDKGEKMKISEIDIDGNQDFSDKRIRRQMKGIKEKQWWRLWQRSRYIPKKMDQARAAIIDFYETNGYRDAEIVFDTVTVNDDNTLDVRVEIYEGNQYYIRDIAFVGNYKYSDDSLRQVLGIESGDIFNKELIDRRLHGDVNGRDISGLYLDDGYLFFNVDPIITRVINDSVDLEIRIFEGPQATIRKVIVEGNTKTSDFVILRELHVRPGDKFSRSALIRSQREILNLGYFNQETLQVYPIPDPATGEVDIKFVVEEKPSDQLQVQGGYGGRIRGANGEVIGGGFVGTVQVGFNNFSTRKFFQGDAWQPVPSGDGQKLNLAVQMNGVGWQNYSISFLEPWLGGKKPNSLGASVYYTVTRSLQTDFRMATLGTSVDYGMRLKWPDDFFRTFTSAAYKYYDIQNGSAGFTSLDFDDGFINIFSLKQTIDRTSIDAPIYPRSGSQMTFSVEATPPYSLFNGKDYTDLPDKDKFHWLEYHKWKFSSTWYFTIWKDLVLKPRMQFGYLGSYNADYGIPPFERFYLGGSGLGSFNFYGWEYVGLRGYPDQQIGPRSADGGTVGGNIFSKYSLELRHPITLNQAAPIWAVAFLEAGNAWLGSQNFNPFELKRSAGVGLRVMLPMVGLLGVDWGYGFDPVTTGQPNGSQFTFILGQEF